MDKYLVQLPVEWSDWQITNRIGRGSYGAVYEITRDVQGYAEKAALKIITLPQSQEEIEDLINEGYNSESITNRFRSYMEDIVDEYSMMSRLKGCANVVHCDDWKCIQHDDGIGWNIFIRMELLTPLVKGLPKASDERRVVQLGKDMCTALVQCRKYNIVHRDIKPQNIFIAQDGRYKLGDFGVAKTAERTASGTKIGTYKYMAPEVYRSEPYNFRADIYSLGLVMYWMLNERRAPFLPLPPDVPTAAMEENARYRRFSGEELPPPLHGSTELKRIVLKACAYDQRKRYQSAEEMLKDLERCNDHPSNLFNKGIYAEDLTVTVFDQHHDEQTSAKGDNARTAVSRPNQRNDAIHDERLGVIQKEGPLDRLREQQNQGKRKKKSSYIVTATIIGAIILAVLLIFTFGKDQSDKNVSGSILAAITSNVETESEADSVPETVHTHTWQDATCTQPKTCLDCGTTEGEAAGHNWIAATTTNPKTCSACGATEGRPILDIVAGDTLTMGYYGGESIVWSVLEFDPATNQVLLISKYCLDAIPFHTGSDYGSWENSTLRKWLNSDFISTAFDQEERAAILTTNISTPQNPDYHIESGGDTSDRVFLLSYDEAVYYFPSKTSRQAKPTDYCKEQGCYDPLEYAEEHGTEVSPEAIGYTWWWLRTAGLDEKHTCNVVAKGTASTYGAYKTSNEGTIRPVMWVQLG